MAKHDDKKKPHDHHGHGRTDAENQLPVVIIETPENVGYVNTPFQINLTLSEDPDGEIVKTVISWGDHSENTAMGRPEWASHRYLAPGVYTITVACMDDRRDIRQLAYGTAVIAIVAVVPFEVEDLHYDAESPNGDPVLVVLDQIPAATGGTPPYDPPVYDPDDLPPDDLFPVGTSICKFYVQDADGRRAYGEATIEVVDTTPPPAAFKITAPADEYITTPVQQAAVTWDDPVGTGGTPPYSYRYEEDGAPVFNGALFAVGVHTVTVIGTDAKRAESRDDFAITVEHVSPIPPGNNQEYFDARVRHPSCVFSYALTSDEEIRKYRRQMPSPYAPYYDEAMHAMRISIPAGQAGSIPNQIWLPIKMADPGQTVIIWEELDGPNWNDKGGFTGWKYYQIRRDADKIWFEIGAGPQAEPYALGKARVRQYSVVGPNTIKGNYSVTDEYGTKQYNNDSIRSAVTAPANYSSLRATPTRHMIVINQNPEDPTYCVFDYYATDPEHPPKAIHRGLEITCPDKAGTPGKGRPQHFDWEINSSQSRPSPGPEACLWGRFVTVHRGVYDPLALFQQITGW